MKLKQCMLTKNRCYKNAQKMTGNKPTGIVVHSTGANNKQLKRYVQPSTDDPSYDIIIADIGKNKLGNHWNNALKGKCVHAFIGVNAAGDVETYQTLPFDVCCWGCGSGSKGSYNYNPQARVQFEICEDNLKDESYFLAVFTEAAEFCAFICQTYGLSVDTICSHKEAHDAGYGNNHKDCDHWLKKHGKTMDWFRSLVSSLIEDENTSDTKTPVAEYQQWLNQTYNFNLVVDGLYGNKTRTASIKVVQQICNEQNGAGLIVDGKFGAQTKAACKKLNLRRGDKGDAVCVLQGVLYGLKYEPKGLDGLFGSGCESAVKQFQADERLAVDGVVGSGTWENLLN